MHVMFYAWLSSLLYASIPRRANANGQDGSPAPSDDGLVRTAGAGGVRCEPRVCVSVVDNYPSAVLVVAAAGNNRAGLLRS